MKIEEAKKYCMDLEYYYVDETHELSKFIDEQQSIINQLEAEKLEAYKHILKHRIIDAHSLDYIERIKKCIKEVEK